MASLALNEDQDGGRIPPHSVEAEQAVLGAVLLDNGRWEVLEAILVESDFYQRDHGLIFRAIQALCLDGVAVDIITVSEWLSGKGLMEGSEAFSYCAMLSKNTPVVINVGAYAGIVRERSVLRQLIQSANQIAEAAFQVRHPSVDQLLDWSEQQIFAIAEQGGRNQREYASMKQLMDAVMPRVHELYQNKGHITGVATGLTDLDHMTAGLQSGDLIILAGRPSMGKTSLAMNIAEHAALNAHIPTGIFSMEMPGEQLAMRMVAAFGRINQSRLRTGSLEDEDWARITSAVPMISEACLFIDDSPGLTSTELRARARRMKREQNIGLLVIDYLQLMQSGNAKENRVNAISEISRNLKALAKELKIPVIALSQLNRNLEQRPDKRPFMSDLRESGSIEQDADLVIFIYRDEVYNEDSPDKGIAEIIIGKHRNGPTGTCRVTFRGEFTRFDNHLADSSSVIDLIPI